MASEANSNVRRETPFGGLSELWTICTSDGRYRLGAGTLADGLIVPLFAGREAAEQVAELVRKNDPKMELFGVLLGDPYAAMERASREGAAGFQFDPHWGDPDALAAAQATLADKTIFPFLVRNEEAGSQWPTVLGSSTDCTAAGLYLTRRGPQSFAESALRQWIRWDVMDFANASMTKRQPFRSHDPGKPFWCLDHQPGAVTFSDGEQRFVIDAPAIVLFSTDSVLRHHAPPEGYLPIFASKEAAESFLVRRLGGAFHIITAGDNRGIPNLHMMTSVMAQDLGPQGALHARVIEVSNLPLHLSEISASISIPPYMKFVVNPAGRREDCAWGSVLDGNADELILRAVSGRWTLSSTHQYSLLEEIKHRAGGDTFYLGASEYKFAERKRTMGVWSGELLGEPLSRYSVAECADALQDYLASDVPDALVPPEAWGHVAEDDDDDEKRDSPPDTSELQGCVRFSRLWVLRYWETVDGERSDPIFLEHPLALIKALLRLESDDRLARVHGAHGYSSIGFGGSSSHSHEDAVGAAFESSLRRIMDAIVTRGYQPMDGLNVQALANATLKSFRVTVCGCAADLLATHLPRTDDDFESLCEELDISSQLAQLIVEQLANDVDPTARELLLSRVGASVLDAIEPPTRLFLATAFLQFEHFGRSPCVDYAPVSLQIVKALEFEIRALVSECVAMVDLKQFSQEPNKYEQTLLDARHGHKERLSLGSLVHAIRKSRTIAGPPFDLFHRQLEARGVAFLSQERTTKFILGDVLTRFRNGGAHDSAISLATCEECIDSLVGTEQNSGLIPRLLVWRAKSAEGR
jgi:hypothetical protein